MADPLDISGKSIGEMAAVRAAAQKEADEIQRKLDELMAKRNSILGTILRVNFLWGFRRTEAVGYLHRRELKSRITVFVKVFHGKRENHRFEVALLDTVGLLYDRLKALDATAMKQYYDCRLLYPMGRLRRLEAHQTFLDQQIPDDARLVLVGKKSFAWDLNTKGPNVRLSNNNFTALNVSHGDYEAVYGTISISSGQHYWEVKVDAIRDMDDVMIGVSPRVADQRSRHSPYERFYGWHATNGRKMRPHHSSGRTEAANYGNPAK